VLVNELVNRRIHEPQQVVPVHANQFTMSPSAEGDLFVFSQAFIRINGHIVEKSEGRHRPGFAVWECVFELDFRCNFNGLRARYLSNPFQINVKRCRNHCHGEDAVDLYDDRLGQFLAGNMCERGHADKMVLSHDANCYFDALPEELVPQMAPNWHYLHIHNDVIPALKQRGVTDEQLHTMLVDNPRRIFERQGSYQ